MHCGRRKARGTTSVGTICAVHGIKRRRERLSHRFCIVLLYIKQIIVIFILKNKNRTWNTIIEYIFRAAVRSGFSHLFVEHQVDSKRRLIETMDSLQRPYPVRADSIPHQHSPHHAHVSHANSPFTNGTMDHHMVNADHNSFQYAGHEKIRRSDHLMAERPIALDPLFLKVLHKIFPQLGTELISRELALYGNDLTKAVEFMLRKYHSALEDVPFHNAIPPTVAEQNYMKHTYAHPTQSPRGYSRESSPSSGNSGYSPGPPHLFTPVVYPSDAKYDGKVYDGHFQSETDHRFERRIREDTREESGHQQNTQYQNGVLSYEEALHISALKTRENAMKMRNQHAMNGQSYLGLHSEDQSDIENEEQNVSSSSGKIPRTMVTSHSQP